MGTNDVDKIVAIKRFKESHLKNKKHRQLLDMEVNVMRKLDHINVVKMYDYLATADYICLVMEFCDNGDLNSYIEKHAPLPEDDIFYIMKQLIDALSYLRSMNIMHRDLKPHNVLLLGKINPIVKLTDFGLARNMTTDDMTSTFCGSPIYMAPEILNGDKYNVKADLWSLGIIFYQCLTGDMPFKATSIKALKNILAKPHNIEYPITTSNELKSLISLLLNKDVGIRIEFEDLVIHPFLRKYTDITEELRISMQEEPIPPTTVKTCLDFEPDFVIIEREYVTINQLADKADKAAENSLNPHGDLNIGLNIIKTIHHRVGIVMHVAANTTGIESLLLYHKAFSIFRQGITDLCNEIHDHPWILAPTKKPLWELRDMFNNCLARIEFLRSSLSIVNIETLPCAEEIMFNHALISCRNAIINPELSESNYKFALDLFDMLIKEAEDDDDVQKIQKYIDHVRKLPKQTQSCHICNELISGRFCENCGTPRC